MKLIDANILLYAVNRDAALHAPVHSWWENTLSSSEPVGLTWIVILAFLRLSTNPRVFVKPLEIEESLTLVEGWLTHPNVRLITESDDQWETFKDLLAGTGTAGNLTTDAFLAAIALSLNATLVSCDTDFRRYPGLRWENPNAP